MSQKFGGRSRRPGSTRSLQVMFSGAGGSAAASDEPPTSRQHLTLAAVTDDSILVGSAEVALEVAGRPEFDGAGWRVTGSRLQNSGPGA